MAVGGCVLLCLLWPCPFPRPRAARFDCIVRMWPLPPFPSPCLARNHSLSRLHARNAQGATFALLLNNGGGGLRVRAIMLFVTLQSCNHAIMLPCYHAAMLPCCHAAMLPCCHAMMLPVARAPARAILNALVSSIRPRKNGAPTPRVVHRPPTSRVVLLLAPRPTHVRGSTLVGVVGSVCERRRGVGCMPWLSHL
jgi:hypothetical protein